jgi:hypothetical protein
MDSIQRSRRRPAIRIVTSRSVQCFDDLIRGPRASPTTPVRRRRREGFGVATLAVRERIATADSATHHQFSHGRRLSPGCVLAPS